MNIIKFVNGEINSTSKCKFCNKDFQWNYKKGIENKTKIVIPEKSCISEEKTRGNLMIALTTYEVDVYAECPYCGLITCNKMNLENYN